MNVVDLKRIVIDQYGELSPSDLAQLAEHAPNTPIGVKVGYGMRLSTTAGAFEKVYAENVKLHLEMGLDQYIREVFIPASYIDLIKCFFGWQEA